VTAGKYADCWMLDGVDLVYNGISPRFRRMPTVSFAGETVRCEEGDTLRDVLLAAEGRTPHNDAAQIANCGGNGLCGTCAVEVDGDTDEQERREARRLSLPPFDGEDGLRLSCQTCVRGDLEVRKHDGLWGQHTEEFVDEPPGAATAAGTAEAGSGADGGSHAEPVTVTAEEYAGNFEYDPAALDPSAGQPDSDPDSGADPDLDSGADPDPDSGSDPDPDSEASSGGEQR
jgi:ferredoxin